MKYLSWTFVIIYFFLWIIYSSISGYIDKINNELTITEQLQSQYKPPKREPEKKDVTIMKKICEIKIEGRKSPLCDDWNLYNYGKKVFEKKWVSRNIALGIMYAESHIWANYAGTCNSSWNNWWGMKYRWLDNWKIISDQKIPNAGNCWLYRYSSVKDYLNSKSNLLANYSGCMKSNNPIKCISYGYVGDKNVAEEHWIKNVSYIIY